MAQHSSSTLRSLCSSPLDRPEGWQHVTHSMIAPGKHRSHDTPDRTSPPAYSQVEKKQTTIDVGCRCGKGWIRYVIGHHHAYHNYPNQRRGIYSQIQNNEVYANRTISSAFSSGPHPLSLGTPSETVDCASTGSAVTGGSIFSTELTLLP